MADPTTQRQNSTDSNSVNGKVTDETSRKKRSENKKEEEEHPPWLVLVTFLLTVILVLGLLASSIPSARLLFAELLVASAAIIVGALFGFLFGMPADLGTFRTRTRTGVQVQSVIDQTPTSNLSPIGLQKS